MVGGVVRGVIEHESDLLVANEQVSRGHDAVDCRQGCQAVGIDPDKRTVDLRSAATGTRSLLQNGFDARVLSGGTLSHVLWANT